MTAVIEKHNVRPLNITKADNGGFGLYYVPRWYDIYCIMADETR